MAWKIGVILSAGGSAFFRAKELFGAPSNRFHVVTDRDCPAAGLCNAHGVPHSRIPFEDRSAFSERTANAFRTAGCDVVLLHYARLVGPELFDRLLTTNVHPALLPAFPGLDGIGDAHKAKAPFQGATLHVVDAGVDTGPVLAQTVHHVPPDATLAWRQRLGYIQKTIVTLYLFDALASARLETGARDSTAITPTAPGSPLCNPGISTRTGQDAAKAAMAELPTTCDWTP